MNTTQPLTPEQVIRYERDGYLIVRDFFSAAEAQRMYEVAVADEQLKDHSYDLNDQSGKRTKLALWYEPGDDVYGLAVRSQKMVGAVEQLLEGTPAHCNTMHTSQANESDHPRWSIISAYNRTDNRPYLDAPASCTRPINVVPDEAILRAEPAGLSGDRDFLAKEQDGTLK